MADVVRMSIEVDARDVEKAERALDGVAREAEQAGRKTKRYTTEMKQAEQTSGKATKTVNRLRRAVGFLSAGIAGFTVMKFAQQIEQATTQLNNINATMRVATGDATEASQAIGFIREEAERLGLFFPAVAKQMAQFSAAARGTSITSEELKTIFTGISEASRAMGLTAPQAEGAMMALQQMMSKGKVSAEELRQQLGERMPGSIQIMAQALDVNTQKLFEMMENGELLSDEVLPKFGRELQRVFGAEAAEQSERIAAAIARLQTAFFDLMAQENLTGAASAINELAEIMSSSEFQDSFDALVQGMSNLAGLAAENVDTIGALAKAFIAVGAGIATMRLTTTISGFFNVAAAANTATGALGAMATASTALSTTLRTLAGPLGLITAVAGLALLFRDNADEAGKSTKNWAMEVERLRGNMAALEMQTLQQDLMEAEQGLGRIPELRDALEEANRLLEIREKRGTDTSGTEKRIRLMEEELEELEQQSQAAMLLRMRMEELQRSQDQAAESNKNLGNEVEKTTAKIKKFAPLLEDLDLLPPDQRVRAEKTRELLDIVSGEAENAALTQEQLLSKVIKTGTEGERIYGQWESAIRDVADTMTDDVSNGLTDIIMQAESAKDVFIDLANQIARTITQQQIADPLAQGITDFAIGAAGNIFGGGAGSASIGGGASPNVRGIGPARANGGNVFGQTAHMVGERGPELFVPRQDGQIVPNNQMGGGGDVTVNVINQGGEQLQAEQQQTRRGPNGEMTVDVMVKKSMERLDSQGQLDGIFRRHGARRQGQF